MMAFSLRVSTEGACQKLDTFGEDIEITIGAGPGYAGGGNPGI